MSAAREVRIAAAADIHFDGTAQRWLRSLLAEACREAEILLLCGDLTTHGRPDQARALVTEMEGVDIPVIAVLGNHDCEAGAQEEVCGILRERGVHLLDGEGVVIEGVGFAGIKGFGGGFGRDALGPFGEDLHKQFVQAALDESLKLECALRDLDAEVLVALLHYAPIADTLKGEPETIYPFLGSSRLLPPIEDYRPAAVFHGHAHHGAPEGRTPGGVPVYNVACSVLREHTGKAYRLWTARPGGWQEDSPEREEENDGG